MRIEASMDMNFGTNEYFDMSTKNAFLKMS